MKRVIMALTLLLAGGNALAEELPDWIKRTTFKGLMFGCRLGQSIKPTFPIRPSRRCVNP